MEPMNQSRLFLFMVRYKGDLVKIRDHFCKQCKIDAKAAGLQSAQGYMIF
jgi:hypothetical protein